ncbi:hypothetical protein ACHAXR_013209 [Thalassiosira sp. AJA248-18]
MPDDESNDLNTDVEAPDAPNGNNGNRKRRMSKRERKNLKKKRTTVVAPAAVATADESSTPTDAHDNDVGQRPEPTLEEYMADYTPAPPPINITNESSSNATVTDDSSKSLGKWFPKAGVIKSSVCYSNDYLAKLAKEKKKQQKQQAGNNTAAAAAAATTEPKSSLVLFYQYVSPTWSQAKVNSFLAYLTTIAQKHRTNIGGRIRVSSEGVNATVSAASTTKNNDPSFEAAQTLRHFTQDLRQFDPVAFANTDFKYIDGLSADRHFKELKILPVKELVFYDIREGDCAKKSDNKGGGKEIKGGIHLDAKEYHEMLKRNDAVVIDVRNHYEAAIGRFDGQMENNGKEGQQAENEAASSVSESSSKGDADDAKKRAEGNGEEAGGGEAIAGAGGAKYIDPKMRKSTDFTSWLAEPETKKKLEGKTVMMFCTGGIRCERASAYLNSQMGSEVKGVYQLHGGVERYLQAFPEGGFWRGKNFVFDKREAIGAGNANGDGGVVRSVPSNSNNKDGPSKKKAADSGKLPWGTECAKCHKSWDRYIGKQKCHTCGVPVLVCDTCQSSAKPKKKKRKTKSEDKNNDAKGDEKSGEENDKIRCPLCIEEGVTVAAEDVEWTDNGVHNRVQSSNAAAAKGGEQKNDKEADNKAAKSVLKWGGGHATKKKEKKKWSRRPCQFGVECVRKDCFFYHPERNGKSQKGSDRK